MNMIRHNQGRNGGSNQLQDEIRQVFDRFFGENENDQSTVATSQWVPRVDIREEPERFIILADIPGVSPDDIEVQMDKGILSIRGERKSEKHEENGKYSRVERQHGVFYRRFALPDSADSEQVSASGRQGVLEISIPKLPETKPRRISVKGE